MIYGENVKPSDYTTSKTTTPRKKAIRGQYVGGVWVNYDAKQPSPSTPKEYSPEQMQQASILYTGEKTEPKTKAEQVVEQIQIRQSFPSETRFIPQDRQISVVMPKKVNVQRVTEPESPFAERLKTQVKREQDIQESYTSTPIGRASVFLEPRPEENLSPSSFVTGKYQLGVAKATGKFILDLPTSTYIIGSRASLFADVTRESFINKKYREQVYRPEMKSAVSKVPKALGEQFNPLTPSGLVNIGIAGLGIKSQAKAYQAARTKTQISLAEIGGKRTTAGGYTLDEPLQFKVKAYQGKTPIEIKGKARAEFVDIDYGQSIAKASGEMLSKGKKTGFELRGLTTKVEGGYDQFSIIKTGKKPKYYADITQTKEIISEPFTSFQQRSYTFSIPKGRSVTQAKPLSASMGGFGELYVEDIFTGKNIFRKEVLSESGRPISTESIIGGSSTTATGLKPLNLRQESIKVRALEDIRAGKYDARSGNLALKSQLKTKIRGGTEQSILNIAKQEAMNIGKGIRTSQVLKQTGRTASLSLSLARPSQAQLNRTRQSFNIKSSPFFKTTQLPTFKPILTTRPVLDTNSLLKPAITGKSIIKPVQTTKPVLKTTTIGTPTFPTTIIPQPPPPPKPPFILIPPIGTMSFLKVRGGFGKGSKGKLLYRPSLKGLYFKLKTPRLRRESLTGFEVRGL